MSASSSSTIDSIAAGGDGVGRADGVVVFVPRTAPGDVVRVRLDSANGSHAAVLEQLLMPSPERTTPDCAHYVTDECGGCRSR